MSWFRKADTLQPSKDTILDVDGNPVRIGDTVELLDDVVMQGSGTENYEGDVLVGAGTKIVVEEIDPAKGEITNADVYQTGWGGVSGEYVRKVEASRIVEASEISKEQFDQIDWRGLEAVISESLPGAGTISILNPQLTSAGYLQFTTNDLVDKTGIANGTIFQTLVLQPFSSGINDDGHLAITLHFQYTHPGGGSNGVTFVRTFYDFEAKVWMVARDSEYR